MAAEKAPAFQFYAKEFLTDGNVASMTLEEVGAYIKLICYCWQDQSLPTDVGRLAIMVGSTLKRFERIWLTVGRCFRERDGRLIHPRLEIEREKQARHRSRQSDKGTAGAAKRWGTHSRGDSPGIAAAMAQALPDDSSPISGLQSEPPVSPPRVVRGRGSTPPRTVLAPAESVGWFDKVYAAYPQKDRKLEATRAWVELGPDLETAQAIYGDIVARVTAGWERLERRFIPQLRKFLEGRMWEDGRNEMGPIWEDDPYGKFPHAWTCRVCGEIHEGTSAQQKAGACLKKAVREDPDDIARTASRGARR